MHDGYLALLGKACEASGQLADDLALERVNALEVDFRLAKGDAVGLHVIGFVDDLRGVQQRFRRDTANIQTDAAE